MKFKKILVPVDGSEPALRALDTACDFMRDHEELQLRVITIVPAPPIAPDVKFIRRPKKTKTPVALMDTDDYAEVVLQVIEDGYDSLQEMVGPSISEFGDRAKIDVAANIAPADGIVEYAHDHGCDLVIMGKSGRGKVKDFLLGSVSIGVLRNSRNAVLTVK